MIKTNATTHDDVTLVREEIVKKINALVSSKGLAGKKSHENKTVINNLRHQISKMSVIKEVE